MIPISKTTRRIIMKKILLTILILGSFVAAQDINKPKLDKLFNLLLENQEGMGSISIFQDGQEIYQNTIGYASIKENIKADKNTKYRIGSITKTFTAAMIMQLIEEGKLSLGTKLSEFYPKITNAERITIEQLLKHRSGIYNFTDSSQYKTWMEKEISKQDLIKQIITDGSIFEPDTTAKYSNSNYVLLSFIAEDIENKTYAEIIKERIFKPCNLQNTFYGSKIEPKNNQALSYNKLVDWELATETDMSVPVGAGAIISTPTDLNIFLNCLFSYQLVSKDSLDKMSEIQEGFNFGMGLFEASFDGKKALGHSGGIDGFGSNAFYFPKERFSLAYISNGIAYPLNDILIGVLSIYLDKDYQLPTFAPAIALKSEDLDKYLGLYSGPSLPLKITISKDGNTLIAQATGQASFALEAVEENIFVFRMAKIEMEFSPEEAKMLFRQAGKEFELARE